MKPRLLYANSEKNADLFYACKFFAPDPFAFLQVAEKRFLLASDLEIDRAKKTAQADGVDSLSQFQELAKFRRGSTVYAGVLREWMDEHHAGDDFLVPEDFPLGLAKDLEALGVRLEVCKGNFWDQRVYKTPDEVAAIRAALRITEAGMLRAFEVLRASSPQKDGTLFWAGNPLTSERLQGEINAAIVYLGGIPEHTIVAGGDQACDPHERGTGPLRANELIILDIFPRDSASGFFGDLTRTVVRGSANEKQKALWQTCLDGQTDAIQALKPGADGKCIHEKLLADFAAAGFPKQCKDGRWSGFFHNTGHGLGLEIHEDPRFSNIRSFEAGNVTTVEPGIYIPGLGGVRHEDVVLVTPSGHEVLSRLDKPLEL